LGAQVVELASGRVIFDLNGSRPMIPASNMKLLVICAALDAFGRDYQFETTLALRGGDLVVIGGGDPTMGDERLAQGAGSPITAVFHDWTSRLTAAGVSRVSGNIVIDDSMFDREFVHPHWPPPQYQSWYEAPVGALNFASNCIEVEARPTVPGKPAEVRVVPPSTLFELTNKSVTGPKQTVTVNRQRSGDAIVVSGSVAKEAKLGPVAVRDPGLFFGHVLKTVLASAGIKVEGKVVRQAVRQGGGKLPSNCRVIHVYRSPITWTLSRAGKQSLGMMAEALIKLLGTRISAVGSWESGRASVRAFLQKAEVPGDQVIVDDGSGLSRNNRLSAAACVAVLRYMYRAPSGQFETLLDVLSHAGLDGTLEKRMKSPATRGRVFAKTGYISGVRTLAGYVQTKKGTWLAFAFFYNQAAVTRPLNDLQDKACRALAEWDGE
jgi:D-alanyl-D-alanine carboxypeptidase/D-alanyl-D-alanine-endopeptidase (penicillin-binding protein 4)